MKAHSVDGNKTVGHAWVGDGGMKVTTKYQDSNNRVYKITYDYYVHCNWGWNGSCDGYYLELDPSNPNFSGLYQPIIDIPGSSTRNFNIDQQMAIMKK